MNKINLGAGKHPIEGWINVDKVELPGITRVFDIFSYPWDFPDNSADEFYLSHIVEHVPHEPKPNNRLLKQGFDSHNERWNELRNLDGFYCFFGEIWRIGVNGAKVKITTPYVKTLGAFSDPTHTRYMTPISFAYLTEDTRSSKDFDYQIPCLFTIRSVQFDVPIEYENKMDEWSKLLSGQWDMTQNMHVELEVVK